MGHAEMLRDAISKASPDRDPDRAYAFALVLILQHARQHQPEIWQRIKPSVAAMVREAQP